MAITKDLEININGDNATFSQPFYIYQNDGGIDLNIKIIIPRLQITKKEISLISDLDGAICKATILKPSKTTIYRDNIFISDDTIKFDFSYELTKELNEIGTYKMQFHLYDDSDNRITIPPVEFEVKELLGIPSEVL